MPFPITDYCETKYKVVAANTTDTEGGEVIPNGQNVAITNIRLNGADPNCYIACIFAYGEENEKIFASTKGDIDTTLDASLEMNQCTGDGASKIQIIIINQNDVQSPIVGGAFCGVKI